MAAKLNLKKLLAKDSIYLDLRAETKDALIREVVDRLAAAGKIEDKEAVLSAIFERERKMSTGMEHGVAIPHGKTDAVDRLVAALAIKKEGIDFQALDGRPCGIFIFTVSPANRTGPHIQFLAEISRILNDSDVRARLLRAERPEDVLDIIG